MFFMTAGNGMVSLFLADLQDRFGLTSGAVGVVAAMGFLAAVVGQVGLAPIVDRGHSGPVAAVAVVVGVAGSLSFGFGTAGWHFVVGRALAGVGLGLFGVAAHKALVGADGTGGGARLGMLLSAAVAGFISGPAIGAATGGVSFAAPFLVLAIGLVGAGVPAVRFVGRTPVAAAPVRVRELFRVARLPGVQAAVVGQMVVYGLIGLFNGTVDRYLTDLGVGTTAIALSLVIIGVPLLVLPRWTGTLAERRGGGAVIVPALVVAVPVTAMYGVITGAVTFVAVGVVHAAVESFVNMGAQLLVLETVGPSRAAVGSSVLALVSMSTAAVTAGLGPVVYARFGEAVLFGGWAAVTAVATGGVGLRLSTHRGTRGNTSGAR